MFEIFYARDSLDWTKKDIEKLKDNIMFNLKNEVVNTKELSKLLERSACDLIH